MEGTTLWGISYEENVGRVLVATQDIEPEETVLEDTALIGAPDGFPTCLGCLAGVDGRYSCPVCSWPLCGAEECRETPGHEEECRLYKESSLVPVMRNYSQPHSMYAMVAVVRMMILKRDDPQKYKIIEELMDHWEERAKEKAVCDMVKYMAAFCRKKLCLDWVKDEDVQHAFGVLKTNGVGHTNRNGSKACFLYPTVSLMSHSCVANLEIVDSPARGVKFVAKRKIKKGEELSWSYTNFLLPRCSIQANLSKTWLFDCQCLRCSDPSELGLYYSSQKCECGGYFSTRLGNSDQCDQCEKKVDSQTVSMEEQSVIKEMTLVDEADLCSIIKRMEDTQNIHSTHHVMVRLYIRLLESVAKSKPNPSVLPAAVQYGQTLLQVLHRLDGERGRLGKKYSKLCALVEYKDLVRRQEEGGLSQEAFQEKLGNLREYLV